MTKERDENKLLKIKIGTEKIRKIQQIILIMDRRILTFKI